MLTPQQPEGCVPVTVEDAPVVERPSRFGWLWYRFWTLLGLRQIELGGFGGLIGGSGGGQDEARFKSGC